MFTPYIRFNGDCEEAFLRYAELFDGKIQHMVKYDELSENPERPLDKEWKNKVMHARMAVTEVDGLTGADTLKPFEKNGPIAIQAHLPEDVARKAFLELAKGGTVKAAIASNPPPDDSSISGCVVDKYGVMWILSAMKSNERNAK